MILKNKYKMFYISIDPINGIKSVNYSPPIDKKILNDFNRISKKKQILILSTDSLVIMPLRKNIIVYDTLNFFHNNTFETKMHYFHVDNEISNISKVDTSSRIYLYAIGSNQDNIIFSFTFMNNKQFLNFYFNKKNNRLSFKKSKVISLE